MDFPIEIQSEFDYIVRSYQFVAAMFSSTSGYTGLLATLGAMGIFFGGMSAISAQAMSGRSAIQSWLANMAVASAVVVLLTSAKSTVIIHDTVSNQMRPVGGVPTVMATLAYLENRVELGVKEIMETVMSPIIPYDDIGKGEGFELLASMDRGANAYFTKSPHVLRSLEDYFKKCVLPDLSQGWIPEKAIYGTDDMWNSIKSNTRTRFSLVYGEGDSVGTLYSCADAWGRINPLLAVAQIKTAVTSQCEEKYDNAAAVRECENNVSDIVSGFVNGGTFTSIDLNSFIRSYLVSYAMYSSHGSLYSMLNEVNKKNASSAFMAEKMLPRLKGMMYGMIIGIFPLLICFMWFSPSKTIVFYAGLFVLLILWSSIDTFLDMQYQNEVYRMFTTMRNNGLGLRQMFDIPNIASDAMSLYGSGRWMALGLATAISAAITGINSYAISQMGSQLGATAQSAAGAAAGYMDSAGAAKLSQQAASDFGYRDISMTMAIPNWTSYGYGQSQSVNEKAATSEMLAKKYGGSSQVAQANATNNYVNRLEGNSAAIAKQNEFGDDRLAQIAGDNALFGTASTEAQLDFMKQYLGGATKAGAKNGAAQGLSIGKNINAMEGEIKGAGGTKEVMDQTFDTAAFNTREQKTRLDTMKEIYVNLNDASEASGYTSAVNQAANISSTEGRIKGAGSVDNLLNQNFGSELYGVSEQKSFLTSQINEYGDLTIAGEKAGEARGHNQSAQNYSAKTAHRETIGHTDATNKMAKALGMEVNELAEFIQGKKVLDEKTAAFLNDTYGTEVFHEGQTLNASMNSATGQLMEMTLSENVKDMRVGEYTVNGTQLTTLNNDGTAANTVYKGSVEYGDRTFDGSVFTDGDGNVVNVTGMKGKDFESRENDTISINQGTNYTGAFQATLEKLSFAANHLADAQIRYDKGEITAEELRAEQAAFAAAYVHDLSAFKNESVGEESVGQNRMYAGGETSAGAKFDAKIFTVGAEATAGFEKSHMDLKSVSETRNPMVEDVMNILVQANDTFEKHFPTQQDMSAGEEEFKRAMLANTIRHSLNEYSLEKLNLGSSPEEQITAPTKGEVNASPNIHKQGNDK